MRNFGRRGWELLKGQNWWSAWLCAAFWGWMGLVANQGHGAVGSGPVTLRNTTLLRTAAAMAATQTVTVVTIGDSLVGNGDWFGEEFSELFVQNYYGYRGGGGNVWDQAFGRYTQNKITPARTGGASIVQDFTRWFGVHTLLPAAAEYIQVGAYLPCCGYAQGGITGNVFEVIFACSNSYGGFDLKTNGVTLATFVCNTNAGILETNMVYRYTNSTAISTTLRAECLSNSVRIMSLSIYDYTQPGVIWISHGTGGATLANYTNCPSQDNIYRAWNPTMVLFKTINGGSTLISNLLPGVVGGVQSNCPQVDFAIAGVHPISSGDSDIVAINVALRKFCYSGTSPITGLAYFPTHELLFDDWVTGQSLGYLRANPSDVHMTLEGSEYTARAMWDFLNLQGTRGLYSGVNYARMPFRMNLIDEFRFSGGVTNGGSNAFGVYRDGFNKGGMDADGGAYKRSTNNSTRWEANYTLLVQSLPGTAATNNVQTTNSLFGTIGTGSSTLPLDYFQNTNRVAVLDVSGDYYTGASPIPWRFFASIDGAAVNDVEGLVTPPASVVQGTWTAHVEWTVLTNSASVGAYTIGGYVQFYGGAGATATLTNKFIVTDNFSTNHTIGLWSTNGPIGATAAAGMVSRRAVAVLR